MEIPILGNLRTVVSTAEENSLLPMVRLKRAFGKIVNWLIKLMNSG
jgi:hypothetical protein